MRHPRKVIHLTEDLGIGGQEKVIATLAAGADRLRFRVEVWCLVRGGPLADRLQQSGVRVRVLGIASYHDPSQVVRLARHLRRAGADIVHVHGSFAGTFGRLSALLAGKRTTLLHVHTTEPGLRLRHIAVQRLLFPFTGAVVCVSEAVRRFMTAAIGLPARKCRVVYNGVPDAMPARAASAARPKGAGGPLAVSLGSLVENKGHRVLIAAFRRAATARPDLRLMIVGGGPLRAALERQAKELGLEGRIRFAGHLPDVEHVLSGADMVIQPTLHREGLPLSLIEAARHGLPAVASRLGGIPEVVGHGRTGLLVPPGDAEALAGAMGRLAAEPSLRERLGNAARVEYERRFRAEHMIAAIEALYDAL